MKPRQKRPRPAMSDKALAARIAHGRYCGIRAMLLLEARAGHKIDWDAWGGRPSNADEILATKPGTDCRVLYE